MMKQIDMHGRQVKEAEEVFYQHLNEARLKNELIEVTFVTGTGAIQVALKKLCAAQDLYHYVPLANRGCIVIEFE